MLGAGVSFVNLSRVKLRRFTELTVTSPTKLRDLLDGVRQPDYAIADPLMELAVRSIAVPVRNAAGVVVAGMNVIVQTGELHDGS